MAYMSKTNLRTHLKLTHKRELGDVLKEEGLEYVYEMGVDDKGRPTRTAVGISGIEVRNVGPSNPRKSKCPKDRMIL